MDHMVACNRFREDEITDVGSRSLCKRHPYLTDSLQGRNHLPGMPQLRWHLYSKLSEHLDIQA